MADANYASIGFIKEVTWGVTPAAPTLQTARITKEGLLYNKETVQSQEVRSDRQVADLVEVGSDAAGPLEFELSYGGLKDFLVSAIFGGGATTVIALVDVTSAITAATNLLEATAGDFDDVPIGATVKIAGATAPENNGLKLVVNKAADGSTLTFAAGSFAGDEAAVDITITGINVKNGLQRDSYTMERRVITSAGAAYFQSFTGMTPDTLSLNFESKTIITGSIGFLGKTGGADDDSLDAAVDATTGYAAANTDPVMNATTNLGRFYMDKEAATECLKKISLNIANGLRGKDCIGTNGNFDVGVGSFEVTGQISGYFINNDLYTRMIEHSDVAFSWTVTDKLGNAAVFTIPRCKLASGSPPIEGRNTDLMVTADFTAILDALTNATLILDFHPAA